MSGEIQLQDECWLISRGDLDQINEGCQDAGDIAVIKDYTPEEYLKMLGFEILEIEYNNYGSPDFSTNEIIFTVRNSLRIYATKLPFIHPR